MKVYKHYKKKNIKSLLLVLALFFLLVSMSVVSYAWIEGSSAVDITNNTNTIKFNNTNTTVNLSTTSYELPLSDYIDNSGSLFLAPAYSSDGKTIQIKRGSADSTLENATVNDIGVNYIEFSLKVKTSAAATYGYTTDSAITVDGEATDAVKVSTQIGTGTALAYDGTGLASQKAFELSGSGTYVLTTRIWCDKDKFSSIQGKNISFNLHLKKMYKVTVNAVANGTVSTDGGVVALDEDRSDISGTATLSKYVVDGSKISIDAVANSGYTFAGWYSAVTGGTKYDYSDTEEITVSSEVNVYARFLGQFTIYGKVSTNSSASNTNGGTISIDGGTAGTSVSKPVNYGTSVTLKATSKSRYRFVGWATTANGTVSSTSTSISVTVTGDKTYYARFVERFSVDAYVVTDGSSSNTKGGTVKAGSSTAGSTSSATVDYGSSLTLTASTNSGYKFNGWYSTATGDSQLSSSTTYTINSITGNKSVYARWTVNSYTYKAYAVSNGTSSNSGCGKVQVTGGSSGATSSATSSSTVTFTATKTANDSFYQFLGWYDSASGGNLITTDTTFTKSGTNYTAYARFVRRVYFTNNKSWNGPYCYAWVNGSSATWPGTQMTYSHTNTQNEKVYYIDIAPSINRLIFNNGNNGGSQTVDITIPLSTSSTGNNAYYISGGSGTSFTVGSWRYDP
ncbi:InlB B-repeat-containing protein [bacterium]|nr:InlB B-repeat-containing protein [bacterium]